MYHVVCVCVCINIYTCNLLVHALLVNHSLYTHVHTHTHTHTLTHSHTHTHTHTLTHSLIHTPSLTLPHHSSPHTLGAYTCCMYTHLCQLQLSCIVCVYVSLYNAGLRNSFNSVPATTEASLCCLYVLLKTCLTLYNVYHIYSSLKNNITSNLVCFHCH